VNPSNQFPKAARPTGIFNANENEMAQVPQDSIQEPGPTKV